MPYAREVVGFGLFLAGGAALAYLLYKQKEKQAGLAVALASYCLLGAVLYGWSGSIVPKTIKAPGFELDTAEQQIAATTNQGLDEIRNESAAQKNEIGKLDSELRDTEKALQQSKQELNAEVERANAAIETLQAAQLRVSASNRALSQRLAPRQLSVGERTQLRTALCTSAHTVAIEVMDQDAETESFSDQLSAAFTSCKWTIKAFLKTGFLISTPTMTGLQIVYWKNSQWAPEVAKSLNGVLGGRYGAKLYFDQSQP